MAKANYELLVGTHMVDAGAGEMVAKVAGDLVQSHADLVALFGPTKFALSSVPVDVAVVAAVVETTPAAEATPEVEVKEVKETKKAGGK